MKEQDIQAMLADVRRAHRLLYQYQERIFHLMRKIYEDYHFPQFPAGRKWFSSPIHNTEQFSKENKKANLNVQGKWAWDFLYSYEMEYYFGKKKTEDQKCFLSVFQISDNGFYMKDGYEREQGNAGTSRTKVEKFWNADQSQSYLIFAVECMERTANPEFFPKIRPHILSLYGKENDVVCKNGDHSLLYAKRYPMAAFFDEKKTDSCLEDFSASLMNAGGMNLL